MTPIQFEECKSRWQALIKDRRGLSFHGWNDCANIYYPALSVKGSYAAEIRTLKIYEEWATDTPMSQELFDEIAKQYVEKLKRERKDDHIPTFLASLKLVQA